MELTASGSGKGADWDCLGGKGGGRSNTSGGGNGFFRGEADASARLALISLLRKLLTATSTATFPLIKPRLLLVFLLGNGGGTSVFPLGDEDDRGKDFWGERGDSEW